MRTNPFYRKWLPLLQVFALSACCYLIHRLLFFWFVDERVSQSLYYSLSELYLFFFSCSILIMTILIFVGQKSLDYVGYTFLLVTVLKMVGAYFFLLPVLWEQGKYIQFEKGNFFVVFALFLTIETLVAARILNNKQ